MSKKVNKKKKRKLNIFSSIICTIFLILFAVFMGLIIYMDILPTKFFSIVVGGLSLVAIVTSLILYIPPIKSKLKVFGIVIAVIFSSVFGFGINKMYNTVDFLNKITKTNYQIENYYVIVLDNQTYDKLEDLKKDKMGILNIGTANYTKARKELLTKTKTTNVDYEDQVELANDLLDEKVDAIFVNESYKANLDEEIDTFKAKTKIIHTISIKTKSKDIAKKVKVTKESFSIFVSGIDTYGKISSVSRSDVNMVVTVNPRTHQILLTSIPRDYYVQLNGTTGLKDKLTHAGTYGVDKSVKTVEDMFGIDINYYVKVNFSTLIKVVDIIGGIDVYSDTTFVSGTDYTCSFRKGMNHLNGKHALAFSRERHAYREGDRHRVKNQQDVITAIMNKMLTSKTLISKYDSLLSAMEGSFQTNMNTGDLTSLIKKQIDQMPKWNITSQSVNGTDSSAVTYSYPGQRLYVMIPDQKTVDAASLKIKAVLDGKDPNTVATTTTTDKTTTTNTKN